MAEVVKKIKLQIPAGKATPAPPVGTVLGPAGKKYAKINKGSTKGSMETVATLTKAQLKEIAEIKLPDLNAYTVEEAMKIVVGTAKNMGIEVEGTEEKQEEVTE